MNKLIFFDKQSEMTIFNFLDFDLKYVIYGKNIFNKDFLQKLSINILHEPALNFKDTEEYIFILEKTNTVFVMQSKYNVFSWSASDLSLMDFEKLIQLSNIINACHMHAYATGNSVAFLPEKTIFTHIPIKEEKDILMWCRNHDNNHNKLFLPPDYSYNLFNSNDKNEWLDLYCELLKNGIFMHEQFKDSIFGKIYQIIRSDCFVFNSNASAAGEIERFNEKADEKIKTIQQQYLNSILEIKEKSLKSNKKIL